MSGSEHKVGGNEHSRSFSRDGCTVGVGKKRSDKAMVGSLSHILRSHLVKLLPFRVDFVAT